LNDEATVEILEPLDLFADTARPELLQDETREHLRMIYRDHGSRPPTSGVRRIGPDLIRCFARLRWQLPQSATPVNGGGVR
jgi:hypothetical protein